MFSPRPRWFPSLLAFCICAPPIALGQTGGREGSATQSALPVQVEMSRLVDLAAQRLHISVDYDPAALKGAVALRLDSSLSDTELWALTNRLLAARGFTTIRTTASESAYSVVKLSEAPNLAPASERQATDSIAPGFNVVITRLQHRPAKEIGDTISKVLSKPGGSITPLGDAGLVMIADLSPRVDQALDLIKLLDVPTSVVTREISVHNLAAPALATLITQVSAKRELVAGEKVPGEVLPGPGGATVLLICPSEREPYWKDLISSLDQRETVSTQSYQPRSFAAKDVGKLIEDTVKEQPGLPADDRFKVVTDELTGSLIVTATPSQHDQIKALVDHLNQSVSAPARPVKSFVIKNRPVKDIQAVLEELLQAGVLESSTAPGPEGSPAAGSQPVFQMPPLPPGANPPPANTSLLPQGQSNPPPLTTTGAAGSSSTPVQGQGTNHRTHNNGHTAGGSAAASESLLSVYLTSDTATNTLIAMAEPRVLNQIETLLKTIDVRQPQVMLEVLVVSLTESQTMDLGAELQSIGGVGNASIRLSSLFGLSAGAPAGGSAGTPAAGAGFTGLVLSPGDFSILIRALQTINHGRTLSMPKVLVANNEQGTIDSVQDAPFASTNASTTVATTSFGGSTSAGTQVTIKPQIGAGDQLNLNYQVSLSSFTGASANPNLPPPKQENKVQSVATIPDGYTVAVGGIELQNQSTGISQVPFVSQIPLLGAFFKEKSENSSKTRFYVFIRASVMRSSTFEDLKYLSDKDAYAAGMNDGFPVVEPRVIR